MRKRLTALAIALLFTMPTALAGPESPQQQAPLSNSVSGPTLTLADLERIAMQNNPTLLQAEANVRASRGRAKQAGMLPNPVVGYDGQELAFKYFRVKSEHFGFIEQTLPLGGKLAKSRAIY